MSTVIHPIPAATPVVAPATAFEPPAAPALRRRPLWQLPAAAQTLLLALSWPPPALRRHIEQVLARQRRCPVVLHGSDAEVLGSLLHDLRTRNPLSEQLQRLLAERHRLACTRVARLRGLPALQQAWRERPASEPAAATLWALLTHPQGPALDSWLPDEVQQWTYTQVRQAVAAQACDQAAQDREAALQAEVSDLRLRLQRQQAQAQQALQTLQAEVAALRGRQQAPVEWARRSEAQPAAPAAPAAPIGPASPASPASPNSATSPARPADSPLRRLQRAGRHDALQPRPRPTPVPLATQAAPAQGSAPPAQTIQAPPAPGLQGRQILCVGGIQHAVARYRQRIEGLGGRFEHHDGGIEDNPHALQGRLERADLVICQAGCINHAAYHRIKQHCQRTGKPCVYLERASLSRFDRALQGLPTASAAAEG